jgi:hypothetical protein
MLKNVAGSSLKVDNRLQVRPFEGREAVEFVQLNVFGPVLINDLLVGGSAVYGGAINPSLVSRRANALDARNDFWMPPFKILTCRARSSSSSVLRSWNVLQCR